MRNLPSGSVQILIQLSDTRAECDDGSLRTIAGPQATVIGQRRHASVYKPSAETRVLCVDFFAHSAFLFLSENLSAFRDSAVMLTDLWQGEEIAAQLAGRKDSGEIFRVVQSALLRRIKLGAQNRARLGILKMLVEHVSSWDFSGVTSISESTGLHRRSIERYFREFVGVSPTAFARTMRITRAAHLIANDHRLNTLDYALDHGFYDQAHFYHDFKAIVGLSPGDYQRSLAR